MTSNGMLADTLVQVPGTPDIFLISGGAKRQISSMEILDALGWDPRSVRPISATVLGQIPDWPSTLIVRDSAPRFSRYLEVAHLTSATVTERLYALLDDQDIAEVRDRLDGDDSAMLDDASRHDVKRLTLALGVHYGVSGVLTKTGLTMATPPDEVHSMGRGRLAAGGSCYYADLVADGFMAAGASLERGTRVLDFGCSSGRVVRVLAAAYPEVEWHGCDPVPSSIEWCREHLDNVKFEQSTPEPPLPYSDGNFAAVFAISIWSHFAEPAAQNWFNEMRRIIRPGGNLIITTHGYQTIAHCAQQGLRSEDQLQEIREALYTRGFWFAPEFGDSGDWGLVQPQWGTAFMTTEWLLAQLCPPWRVIDFAAGRVECNQDLIVLERR